MLIFKSKICENVFFGQNKQQKPPIKVVLGTKTFEIYLFINFIQNIIKDYVLQNSFTLIN